MATATYTLSPVDTRAQLPRSFSTPLTGLQDHGRSHAGSTAKTGQKRAFSVTPRESMNIGMDRQITPRDEEAPSHVGTPTARPQSWLRRFSSNMTSSRDSYTSRTPTSRPASVAVSYSNGSATFSHAGSATPIFQDTPPSALPRNRLVKRTSSVRSNNNGSPSPGSRLPLPVFKRPATSHQRSANMQEQLPGADSSDHMSVDTPSEDARDHQLRQYFTPRVAAEEPSAGRRRSSTGIPNPIKRVYPDRKYTPILVSGRELVQPARLEVDDGFGASAEDVAATKLRMVHSVASSPLPAQTAHFEEASIPKRSFSIGKLLSTGPQPQWRRPPSSKGNASASKLARRARPRVTSAPQASMGSSLSSSRGNDSEPPAKRRDLTDPQAANLSVYSSSSSSQPVDAHNHEFRLDLGARTPVTLRSRLLDSPIIESASHVATPSPLEQRRLPSATVESTAARHARTSAAPSEITSTVSSDSERRSTGGFSTDYQSDTVYDSYPTRTTRSGSGKRGPPIDTIFDDSPPTYSSGRSTKLHDLLSDGTVGNEQGTRYRHSIIEEEESVLNTPGRSMRDNSVRSTPSARPGAQKLFLSSPPAMSLMPDPDDIDWDAPESAEAAEEGVGIEPANAASTPHVLDRNLQFLLGGAFTRSGLTVSAHSTPHRYSNGGTDKANPFDWSEQQPSPSHQTQSPPRPRTVHGKKDPENRGSRPVGRRAPSGMHARSHSVPVVPDVDGKRNVVANKFGTWGVGTKGVTEDWNEDFDFDEAPPPLPELDERRIDSGHAMFVPKSIREQQENVVANISLLREWGLLIEELKDLRIRAVALDMLTGPYAHAWQEVDAMIELADQESEEATLQPQRSPPSSPGFDYSAFEEPPLPPLPSLNNGHRPRGNTVVRVVEPVLTEDEVVLGPRQPSPHPVAPIDGFAPRPRKDSEAVARSVIEALQSKRSVSDPTALKGSPVTKKVPFDTATLRHIVPYVNGLKRKVKDALRETEGLYSSPRRQSPPAEIDEDDVMNVDDEDDDNDDTPAFRSIFNEPQGGSPMASKQRTRRERAATDNDGFDEPFAELHTDLAKRMQNMTLRS